MTDCPQCREMITASLIGACASVGIEHGRTTAQELRLYLASRHVREGHGS